MLGLEPLYLACEGRLVIFAPRDKAEDIVSALRKCKNSGNAAVIGEVTEDNAGRVVEEQEFAESKKSQGYPEPGNASADGFTDIPTGLTGNDLPFK